MVLSESLTSRYAETHTGINIHYNQMGDNGDAIIFLHGGGPGCTSWLDFRFNAPAFADTYRCYLVDLPLYGRSDQVTIEGGTYTFLATVVRDFMDAVDIQRAHLVCQSFGGCVGIKFAIDYPNRLNRLVFTGSQPVRAGVLAPIPLTTKHGMKAVKDYYGGDGPSPAKMRELLDTYEWYDGSRIPEATVAGRYEMSKIANTYDPALRGTPEDLTADLHLNEAPTLIVWGKYDWFGGPDVPLMMSNRFPNADLVVLPDCAHHLQEEVPDKYNRLVLSFLES